MPGGWGGSKAPLSLAGRRLIAWPLEAMAAAACDRLVVVCKPDTVLPPLGSGVERWDEPAEPLHPMTGLAFALRRVPVLAGAVRSVNTPEQLAAAEAELAG